MTTSDDPNQTLTHPDGDDDLAELEREATQIQEKILHYAQTLPDRLVHVLSSNLASRRPRKPSSQPLPSTPTSHSDLIGSPNIEVTVTSRSRARSQKGRRKKGKPGKNKESQVKASELEVKDPHQEVLEKLSILREKSHNNILQAQKVLERMNNCLAKIESVDNCDIDIHPVFKRRCNLV